MQRLLCLISVMNTGGAETFLMKLYRQMDRTKYQMDFCVNVFEEGFYDSEINKLGGRIYRIPPKSSDIKAFKSQLMEIIANNHYKYVMRVTSNCAGFMDLKIAKQAGAEVCIVRSSNSSDGEGLKQKIAHRMGRLLYGRYVDKKIAPSDVAAEYTFGRRAYRNGEVKILHNALDLNVYRYTETGRNAIRKEFSIEEDTKVIGHIGRFNHQKNHEFLIKIFNEIHRTNTNTILLLVGSGELEQEIRSQIATCGLQDSVIFAGIRSDIPSILSAMDVFLFPSLYEGMPNTVIEAQATGLPCVISDTITKEANITGIVRYMDISASPETWSKAVLLLDMERKDVKDKFLNNGYDIESQARVFVEIVFGG